MKAQLISRDIALARQVAQWLAAAQPPVTLYSEGEAGAPDLLLFDAASTPGPPGPALAALHTAYPASALILLAPDRSPDMLLQAIRSGVSEVLALPLDQAEFTAALERFASKARADARAGRVLAFVPSKGGSGASFIAANLAYALAARWQKKVLLIDLNAQAGHAALYLSDKAPAMTLPDLCRQIHRIDAAFLEASVLGVLPNFGVLAAAEDAGRAADVEPGHIDTLLRLARRQYDYVVLDLGRQLDAVAIRALDNAEQIFAVLQLALPAIRDTRRLLDSFQALGYPRDKTRLIVNRHRRGGKLGMADAERVLGGAALLTVPNDYDAVSDCVNQGVPILQLAARSAVAKSLLALAAGITGVEASGDGPFRGGLLQGMLRGATRPGA